VNRYAAVAAWPLRELCLAEVERRTREAVAAYQREVDRYYHGRIMKDKPTAPAPVRDR
jgi:hypothetical protein